MWWCWYRWLTCIMRMGHRQSARTCYRSSMQHAPTSTQRRSSTVSSRKRDLTFLSSQVLNLLERGCLKPKALNSDPIGTLRNCTRMDHLPSTWFPVHPATTLHRCNLVFHSLERKNDMSKPIFFFSSANLVFAAAYGVTNGRRRGGFLLKDDHLQHNITSYLKVIIFNRT